MNSRHWVFLVTWISILGCLLFIPIGNRVIEIEKGIRKQAGKMYSQRMEEANTEMEEEIKRLNQLREEGKISPSESSMGLLEEIGRFSQEERSAKQEFEEAILPISPQALEYTATAIVGVALVLCVIARLLWQIRGRQLLNELRRRGYDFLTIHDALWLALIMPRRAFTMPSASDYLTVPGSTPDIRGLIAFLGQKR